MWIQSITLKYHCDISVLRFHIIHFLAINKELESYNLRLMERPQIIVANKMDMPESQENLEEFKKIPIRVGVAYGLDKKEAILGVLRGGYVNVLITDEKVANYLIEETK